MLATFLQYMCFLFSNWRDSTFTLFPSFPPPIADIFCTFCLSNVNTNVECSQSKPEKSLIHKSDPTCLFWSVEHFELLFSICFLTSGHDKGWALLLLYTGVLTGGFSGSPYARLEVHGWKHLARQNLHHNYHFSLCYIMSTHSKSFCLDRQCA